MKPACVFCGNQPNDKNKEHVFPKWLLKMTGFDKKEMSVGSNWDTKKEIVFNSLSYTFPACKSCNDAFAVIEGKVKPIMEKLLLDQDVTGLDIELLLDWFDKIRISAWLGVKYLNKDFFRMTPKYYINQRKGIKDRYLSITNTYQEGKTLNISGINTIGFMLSPTALTLRVNNLIFVNCSSDLIVSRKLGFPYRKLEIPTPDSETVDVILGRATKKMSPKIFDSKLYTPCIFIAQPIFKIYKEFQPSFYDDDYVKDNSYDHENGVGKLFMGKGGKIKTVERDDTLNFAMPDAKVNLGKIKVVQPIIDLQIELLLEPKRNLKNLTAEQKVNEFKVKKLILDSLIETAKIYNY
ncbi:hypothetical protein SB719_15205 [Pantoea sp. SIMBA_079]|uniref:hypothetical protein n=1 Tax=Pantoea sp. SIMBA_079 TaxID=3085817 RepID=UPI0039961D3A